MNWFNSLTAWLRPRRRKRTRSEPVSAAIPVPRVLQSRASAGLPRFSGPATEPDNGPATANSPDAARLSQAFTPAQPVSDLRRFAGRKDVLERLIRTLEDRRMHVVVYGDRGVGKTSLLHILTILAREARYIVRYTSCSEDSEFDDVFRAAASSIRLLYHREFDPTSPEAEKGMSLSNTFSDKPLTPASLSEALAKLAGTRLILILDEFDRATSPAFRKGVAELIKNLSDRSARVQIVIGGVAANLTELVEHIPSIRRNVLGMKVGPMADDELQQIITNAQAIGRFTFDGSARDALLVAGNGSPYLVNLIGQQAGRNALSRGTSEISVVDLRSAVGQIETELRDRLSPAALAQLSALETQLSDTMLRTVGQYAQNSFGELLAQQSETVKSALKKFGQDEWWSDTGEFRFADDSIPVILWLNRVDASEQIDGIPAG
jgi:Cdc6-like AAA superfamily ATPase